MANKILWQTERYGLLHRQLKENVLCAQINNAKWQPAQSSQIIICEGFAKGLFWICSIILSGIRLKDGYHQKSPYNSLTNAAAELDVVFSI